MEIFDWGMRGTLIDTDFSEREEEKKFETMQLDSSVQQKQNENHVHIVRSLRSTSKRKEETGKNKLF